MQGEELRSAVEQSGVSFRTLQPWVARYRRHGPTSLARQDRGVRRSEEMARFPQLYSRIGFVLEFRPLAAAEVQKLLWTGWTPSGVTLPRKPLRTEVLAAIIRMTGGNFRLLDRLLAQIERVLKVN